MQFVLPRLIVSLFRQIVFIQVSILGWIITGDVFAFDGGYRDDICPDAFTQSPLTPVDSDLLLPAFERRMTLQPFLQDVVDVRLAELPVTRQFVVQAGMILTRFVPMLKSPQIVDAPQIGCSRRSRLLVYFLWFDVNSQFHVLPKLFPTDLVDLPLDASLRVSLSRTKTTIFFLPIDFS